MFHIRTPEIESYLMYQLLRAFYGPRLPGASLLRIDKSLYNACWHCGAGDCGGFAGMWILWFNSLRE